MLKVDLNCDLGESFGAYSIGNDQEIIKYVSSVNIACGWHAGDPLIMEKTVKLALENGVAIGAHPGLNDLMGFGRRPMAISPKEAKLYIKYQVGALLGIMKGYDAKLIHVKPHGALYNLAAVDKGIARAVAEAVYELDNKIILLGLANSELIDAASLVGIKSCSEVFADRVYNSNGTLMSRNVKGAVITDSDKAIDQVIQMIKKGTVNTVDQKEIGITAESICVHGDGFHAVDIVKKLRRRFDIEEIVMRGFNQDVNV